MLVQLFSFVSYYFILLNWIWWFHFFYFQETYNSWLRERCRDDHSTHPDFNPDLWIEEESSGGFDRNQVHRLSNIMTKNLRDTVVSKPLGAHNQYRAHNFRSSRPYKSIRPISLKNMKDSPRIMKNSTEWSWIWDHKWVVCVRPFLAIWSRERQASSSSSGAAIVVI
jgi:hypothetical protein